MVSAHLPNVSKFYSLWIAICKEKHPYGSKLRFANLEIANLLIVMSKFKFEWTNHRLRQRM